MGFIRRLVEEGAKQLNEAMVKLEREATEARRQQASSSRINYYDYQSNHSSAHAAVPPVVPSPNYSYNYQANQSPNYANNNYQTNHGPAHAPVPRGDSDQTNLADQIAQLEQCLRNMGVPKSENENTNSSYQGGPSRTGNSDRISRAQHLSNMRVQMMDAQSLRFEEGADRMNSIVSGRGRRRYVYMEDSSDRMNAL